MFPPKLSSHTNPGFPYDASRLTTRKKTVSLALACHTSRLTPDAWFSMKR
jgi:hypothetical protein